MKSSDYVMKCITIRKEQEEFLVGEGRFKLSRFVQDKLDEYIKLKQDYKNYMEDDIVVRNHIEKQKAEAELDYDLGENAEMENSVCDNTLLEKEVE